jgi:hypothetical protein
LRLIRGRASSRATSTVERYNPSLDPPLGARLPTIRAVDLRGIPHPMPPPRSTRGAIIVFVGACAPCAVESLRTWAKTELPVFALFQSDSGSVASFRERYDLPITPLIEPASTSASSRYNIGWRPRAYVVDRLGRLRYLQRPWEDSDTASRRVRDLVRADTVRFFASRSE